MYIYIYNYAYIYIYMKISLNCSKRFHDKRRGRHVGILFLRTGACGGEYVDILLIVKANCDYWFLLKIV